MTLIKEPTGWRHPLAGFFLQKRTDARVVVTLRISTPSAGRDKAALAAARRDDASVDPSDPNKILSSSRGRSISTSPNRSPQRLKPSRAIYLGSEVPCRSAWYRPRWRHPSKAPAASPPRRAPAPPRSSAIR